jgi:hypothetical protein
LRPCPSRFFNLNPRDAVYNRPMYVRTRRTS